MRLSPTRGTSRRALRRTRRPLFLAVAGALVAGTLAACSTGSTESSETQDADTKAEEGAFPVTIEHAFGKTTVKKEPKRVATVGYVDADFVLSLGVVPVGATKIEWGGNMNGSTPWFDEQLEELDADQPKRYSEADGIPTSEINKLDPDLIIGTNSGLTEEDYQALQEIAPTIAYPDAPWVTPWDTSLEMVGKALGRSDLAKEKQQETVDLISDTSKQYGELTDKTFIFGSLTTTDMSKIDFYTPEDNRPRLLSELGMKNAPIVEQLSKKGSFYETVSAERAKDMKADVFITYGETEGDLKKFQDNPLLGEIPGIKDGHVLVSLDKTGSLGFSSPSPIALPYSFDAFLPELVKAVEGS